MKTVTAALIIASATAVAGCAATQPSLPANHLTCSHMGPGTLEMFDVTGHLLRSLNIRTAVECSWDYLSAQTAGQLVQHWQNPPIEAELANGDVVPLPSDGEWLFFEAMNGHANIRER